MPAPKHTPGNGATTRNSSEAAQRLAVELHFLQRSHELISADARPGVTLGRLSVRRWRLWGSAGDAAQAVVWQGRAKATIA